MYARAQEEKEHDTQRPAGSSEWLEDGVGKKRGGKSGGLGGSRRSEHARLCMPWVLTQRPVNAFERLGIGPAGFVQWLSIDL